jgi:hypothetical protein
MGMSSGSIEMCQLPDTRGNWTRAGAAIEEFLGRLKSERGASQDNSDYFAVVLLGRSTEYPEAKKVFSRMGILTQMLQKFTAKKINLSVASNVMK